MIFEQRLKVTLEGWLLLQVEETIAKVQGLTEIKLQNEEYGLCFQMLSIGVVGLFAGFVPG